MPTTPSYDTGNYGETMDGGQNGMIAGLVFLGAFAGLGIVAAATGGFVATGAPLVASYPSVVPGTLFIANSAAHAVQIAEALAAVELSILTKTQIPQGATDVLTTLAIAGPLFRTLILGLAAGGALSAYGQGEHAPAYDGLGGVLTYPSGNPTGNIHSLVAIGVNTAAGGVGGVQFFVKFHCEAF